MKLLIDSGNSRLKWALLTAQDPLSIFVVDNQEVTQNYLFAEWSTYPPPEQVLIASVATHTLVSVLLNALDKIWPGVQISVLKSQALAYGVINSYEQADKLGVDRWLALIAAHHYYAGASCIVDCGTAITVDVITAGGVHKGGLISPGIALMKKALAVETANLFYKNSAYPIGLATVTESAIYNGTLYAALGLIERVLTQQSPDTQLILTGGDAALIAAQLSTPFIIDTELVFKGLSIIAKHSNVSASN